MDKQNLKWLYNNIKKFIPLIISLTISASGISVGSLLLAVVSKRIIDIAIGSGQGSIVTQMIYLSIIILAQAALNIYKSMASVRIEGKIQIKLRNMVISSALKAQANEVNRLHSGEIMNLFTNDIDVITNTVVTFFPSMCSLVVKLLGGLVLLAYFDWRFTLVCCGLGAIIVLASLTIKNMIKNLHKECQQAEGKVRSFAQELVERKEVVKTFNAFESVATELQHKNEYSYEKKIRRNFFANISSTSYFLFFSVGYYAGLLWGIGQVNADIMTFGTLTAFLQIIEQIRTPIREMSSFMPRLFGMFASIERITALTNMTDDYAVIKKTMEPLLKLNNVSFAYDNDPVIHGLTFEIKKGERVGIYGYSGSGKTTLIKLMLGLLKPCSGELVVKDGMDGIAYVPQGNMLMSGTIRENLVIFNKSSKANDDEFLYRILELACAKDFVEELPDKLDTDLGEKGLGLSEGQLQRLAIARAFAMQSDLIIFDEATASLDKGTEAKLMKNLESLDAGIIWITHKTNTLEFCDRIVSLEEEDGVF